nr:LapA family protein [Pseudooceanicola algae]
MKYIRYGLEAVIALVLISIAVANRDLVTIQLLPEGLAEIAHINPSVTLPLFLIILAGILVGLLIGFVWEWRREHKHRVAARKKDREAHQLKREVTKLKGEKVKGQDDVLALLD